MYTPLSMLDVKRSFNCIDETADTDLSVLKASLPTALQRLMDCHDEDSEYLTALMTTLVVGGSIIPEVSAIYDRRRIYPNLMLFIVCPPAGGKGVVSLGTKLLQRINRHLSESYQSALASYQQQMDQYRSSLKTDQPDKIPTRPKRAQLLVPGNITTAKFIQQMADNQSLPLIMVETEADVIAGSFKSDHGSQLSTLFRQAYHHERVGLSRKTNNELIEIEKPKLSVVIAGTDNQILSIFKGNQDGLYSRFLFLRGVSSMQWRSLRPSAGSSSLDDHYTEWSEWFYRVWLQTQTLRVEVSFTDKQWDLLDERGQQQQATAHFVGGDYSVSIARRHGLMVIRLAMTLSFFRRVDPVTGNVDGFINSWVCDDVDFELALMLANISFQKSLNLYRTMPQHPSIHIATGKRMTFFNALPAHFEMKTVNAIASGQGVAERTKTRWLSSFCETGMLVQIDRGEYKKTAMAAVAEEAVDQIDA
ncbi:DUF3987 domain-containing protein [Spirosoma validum]|uniref:DUF3987 domain-containing protein n=1 Tax=Spirosoma validum TaxID=2771355 RepID=A0A927GC79_9BACT|nr:DUF3987 domain-containing protein [Spirosoma validum]MBD2752482.1 DUF3987 domain-containing protein [Spirosoma validum]